MELIHCVLQRLERMLVGSVVAVVSTGRGDIVRRCLHQKCHSSVNRLIRVQVEFPRIGQTRITASEGSYRIPRKHVIPVLPIQAYIGLVRRGESQIAVVQHEIQCLKACAIDHVETASGP